MKIKALTMALTGLMMLSCQQEEFTVPETYTSTAEGIRLVEIIDGSHVVETQANTRSNTEKELALQFPSENSYQAFLENLKNKTHKERISYIQSMGLTSLQEIAEIADIELDSIGAIAISENDFRNKYNKYTEKYNGILINNQYDPLDLSLYVPDGENLSTYTINANRHIVIGNDIKKISLMNDLSSQDKSLYVQPAAQLTDRASGRAEVNGKKTIYEVKLMQNICLNVHIGFQKKMWYGWKRDNARDAYYFLDISSPFQYTFWLTPEGEGAPTFQTNITCPDMYFFPTPGTTDYNTGFFLNHCNYVKGNLYVWTDQTAEKDSVFYNTLSNNSYKRMKLRRCDRNKAYKLDFTVDYIY